MNILDLDELSPVPEREPGDIDMFFPVALYDPDGMVLRMLSILLLFTVREGGGSLLLRMTGDVVQLRMSVGVRWVELVNPPIHLAVSIRRLVWCVGRPGRRIFRKTSLLREFGRRGSDAPEPPWDSRFQVRLGDGIKQVVAKAESFPGETVEVTLRLSNVSISRSAAEAKLKEVFPSWRDQVPPSEGTAR